MTLKERVEQNVVIWLLGTLLAGFLGGVATYRSVQEIAGIEPISSWELKKLREIAAKADIDGARESALQRNLEEAKKEQNSLTEQLQAVTAERDRLRADNDALGASARHEESTASAKPLEPAAKPPLHPPSPCFGLTNVKIFAPASQLTEDLSRSLQDMGCTVQRQPSAQLKPTIIVFYPEDLAAADQLRTRVEPLLPLTVEQKRPIRGERKGEVLIGLPGPG